MYGLFESGSKGGLVLVSGFQSPGAGRDDNISKWSWAGSEVL
jgi:hypothetical protein